MSGKTRISMMGPKGEKVCLISCSGWDNQRGSIRSDPPPGGCSSRWGSPTCEPRADPPAVHGAVAGAGLVHHVVEAQLLGVACTQKTEGWLSGSRGGRGGGLQRLPAQLRTFVGGLRGWGLSCGPVGSDLPASQPLAPHLLDGVLRILEAQCPVNSSKIYF